MLRFSRVIPDYGILPPTLGSRPLCPLRQTPRSSLVGRPYPRNWIQRRGAPHESAYLYSPRLRPFMSSTAGWALDSRYPCPVSSSSLVLHDTPASESSSRASALNLATSLSDPARDFCTSERERENLSGGEQDRCRYGGTSRNSAETDRGDACSPEAWPRPFMTGSSCFLGAAKLTDLVPSQSLGYSLSC